jgi:hypothetical protein
MVTRMLVHPDTAELSNRQIARLIGCSHTRVNQLRHQLEGKVAVEQALSQVETVSTRAKNPQTIERQKVAALLDLPPQTVKTYEQQFEPLKNTLKRDVAKGTPLDQAIARLRQRVQQHTAPKPKPVAPRPAQADAAAIGSEAPQAPPPTATASRWAEQVTTAVLRQAGFPPDISGVVPAPTSMADHLHTALLVEPHHLEAGTASDVTMALQLARERVEGTIREHIEAASRWLSALRSLPDTVVVCQVIEALEGQRLSQPPTIARAIGNLVKELQAWIAACAPGTTTHPARRTVAL